MAYRSPRLDLISFCVYWGEVREKFIILYFTMQLFTHKFYNEIHEFDIVTVLVLSAATDLLFTPYGIFV